MFSVYDHNEISFLIEHSIKLVVGDTPAVDDSSSSEAWRKQVEALGPVRSRCGELVCD